MSLPILKPYAEMVPLRVEGWVERGRAVLHISGDGITETTIAMTPAGAAELSLIVARLAASAESTETEG